MPQWVAPLLAGLSLASSLAACVTIVTGDTPTGAGSGVEAPEALGAEAFERPGRGCTDAAEGAGTFAAAPPPEARRDPPRAPASSGYPTSCQTGLSVDTVALDSD